MTLDELDRLAAEKVMGFTWNKFGFIENQGKESYALRWSKPNEFEEFYGGSYELWQPTRNISQAWECLEKFTHEYSWRVGPNWCSIEHHQKPGLIHCTADAAPEAIIRACLKAKGVEV